MYTFSCEQKSVVTFNYVHLYHSCVYFHVSLRLLRCTTLYYVHSQVYARIHRFKLCVRACTCVYVRSPCVHVAFTANTVAYIAYRYEQFCEHGVYCDFRFFIRAKITLNAAFAGFVCVNESKRS